MAEATLQARRRTTLGKKVKQLRRQGVVPGNVYGRGRESIALQAELTECQRVFRSVDRNSVVQLRLDDDETIPVVLRQAQRHPVTHQLLHLELYEVDLTRRIHSDARLMLTGDSEAVTLGGTVVQSLEYITLEALPNEMPSEVVVHIDVLTDFGQSVLVRDLELPDGVVAVTEDTVAVATALAPRVAEEDEEELEGIELEGEEGEEPAEGEAADTEEA